MTEPLNSIKKFLKTLYPDIATLRVSSTYRLVGRGNTIQFQQLSFQLRSHLKALGVKTSAYLSEGTQFHLQQKAMVETQIYRTVI